MAVPMRLANSTCLGLFTIFSTPEAGCSVMERQVSAHVWSALLPPKADIAFMSTAKMRVARRMGPRLRGDDAGRQMLQPYLLRRVQDRMDVAGKIDAAGRVHGEAVAEEFLGALGGKVGLGDQGLAQVVDERVELV